MRKIRLMTFPMTLLLVACLVIISACAERVAVQEFVTGKPAGFWMGLWHGIIAPFSFIVSIFDKETAMYAVNNNGTWYDFGFVLGAGILFGGSSKTTNKK